MVQTVIWTIVFPLLHAIKVFCPCPAGRAGFTGHTSSSWTSCRAHVAFPQEQFLDKVMVFTRAVVQTVLTDWRSAVTVHHGRRRPCHYAEADSHGPCDQEIPLSLDIVIDFPVVQVVQFPGQVQTCGKLWFPQLQFLSRRLHASCCARLFGVFLGPCAQAHGHG